jgi:hypothetical protein
MRAVAAVAANVRLHGARPWHLKWSDLIIKDHKSRARINCRSATEEEVAFNTQRP